MTTPSSHISHTLSALTKPVALAVGMFDGVHVGHQAIFSAMNTFAKKHNLESWVLSFDGVPFESLQATDRPLPIYDSAQQEDTLLTFGANLIRQIFTPDFSNLSAEAFLSQLHQSAIFCGADWRFGKGAEGDVAFLRTCGVDVHVVDDVCYASERISSTRIRAALINGKFDEVEVMLGRPWTFYGKVCHGRGLAAKTFGVPTLNVPYIGRMGEMLTPIARGVYVGKVTVLRAENRSAVFQALINFGVAPTVKGEASPLFEVHLPGVSGDFYGADVQISINTPMIRREQKFESLEALRCQIYRDLAMCKERFVL